MKWIQLVPSILLGFVVFSCVNAQSFFDAYPSLKNKISQVSLGTYPSPVYNLAEFASCHNMKAFYVKDDGACGPVDGQGRVLPSGNKVRKLEFYLAEAKNKGYATVLTTGSAGSSHALATAIYARLLGLEAVLLLGNQRPTSYTVRNLKLMAQFAKEIKYSASEDAIFDKEAQDLCQKEGYYYIPAGGTSPLGDLGYVSAMFELQDQIKAGVLPEPDIIYISLGTTGTAAGAILGAMGAGIKSKIIPVRISWTPEYKINLLISRINETGTWLKALDPTFPFVPATPETVSIENNFAGGTYSYALATPEAANAIDAFYQETEKVLGHGIKLEPTYTSKTLSAILGHEAQGILKDKTVLFWNTFSYGTFEEFTSSMTQEQLLKILPVQLHHYLTDQLQPLDRGC